MSFSITLFGHLGVQFGRFFNDFVKSTELPPRLSVGFAHGVMNTDNMSVASITIDYGPFGFVDEYNPNFIPNTSDDTGRYDLESQASAVSVRISDTNQIRLGHFHPGTLCRKGQILAMFGFLYN